MDIRPMWCVGLTNLYRKPLSVLYIHVERTARVEGVTEIHWSHTFCGVVLKKQSEHIMDISRILLTEQEKPTCSWTIIIHFFSFQNFMFFLSNTAPEQHTFSDCACCKEATESLINTLMPQIQLTILDLKGWLCSWIFFLSCKRN